MRVLSFKTLLHTLYGVGFTFVALVGLAALPYYQMPLSERPHAALHVWFKPGGLWGHGMGIAGSTMILLLFLYSARKRHRLGLRSGRLSRWLDIHIFFGVMGPLLITLHTAMKFHGFVSVSYFSMVVVALSGVFGRYVYMQIPRDARGHTVGLDASRQRIGEIQERMTRQMPPDATAGIQRFTGAVADHSESGFRAVLKTLGDDLTLPWRARRLRRFLRQGKQKVPERELNVVVRLAREQSVLIRRIAMLETMTRSLQYWHVFHKPFAYVMIAVMFIHIAVAVSFGYTWIF